MPFALITLVVAAVVDPLGTYANLTSDLFLIGVVTVGLRAVIRQRDHNAYEVEARSARRAVLAELRTSREQLIQFLEWIQNDTFTWTNLHSDSSYLTDAYVLLSDAYPGPDLRSDIFAARHRSAELTAFYDDITMHTTGLHDQSSMWSDETTERIWRSDEMRVRRSAGTVAALDLLDAVRTLRWEIASGYDIDELLRGRPDSFPAWASRLGYGGAIVSLIAGAVGVGVLHLGADLLTNLLIGLVVTMVGTVVAAALRDWLTERRRASAGEALDDLGEAVSILLRDRPEDADLRDAAQLLRISTHTLQHIAPHPLFDTYADSIVDSVDGWLGAHGVDRQRRLWRETTERLARLTSDVFDTVLPVGEELGNHLYWGHPKFASGTVIIGRRGMRVRPYPYWRMHGRWSWSPPTRAGADRRDAQRADQDEEDLWLKGDPHNHDSDDGT